MKLGKDIVSLLLVLGVAFVAYSLFIVPASPQSVINNQTPGLNTQNPSLELSCLDLKTQQANNECTVRVLDNGALIKASTTASGVVSITSLKANTNYTLEVVQPGSATAFYPFSTQIQTASAGPVTKALFYNSQAGGTPSVSVYNWDNITANSTAQAVGANDSGTFRVRIRPAASTNDNNLFGDNQAPILIVIDANSGAFSGGISMKGSDGSTLTGTGSPVGHVVPDKNRSSSYAFLANLNQLKPATDYDFYITVKSGTQNPANSGDANCGLVATVYDSTRYQNIAGAYLEGWRNADTGADLGAANYSAWVNCS